MQAQVDKSDLNALPCKPRLINLTSMHYHATPVQNLTSAALLCTCLESHLHNNDATIWHTQASTVTSTSVRVKLCAWVTHRSKVLYMGRKENNKMEKTQQKQTVNVAQNLKPPFLLLSAPLLTTWCTPRVLPYLARDNFLIDLDGLVSKERWVAGCHFIDEDSQSPPIHRLVVALHTWSTCFRSRPQQRGPLACNHPINFNQSEWINMPCEKRQQWLLWHDNREKTGWFHTKTFNNK